MLGYVGVFFYLFSYFLLNTNKINGNGAAYITMNLLGASFVMLSLIPEPNGPSVVIQGTWILLSLYGLGKIFLAKKDKSKV